MKDKIKITVEFHGIKECWNHLQVFTVLPENWFCITRKQWEQGFVVYDNFESANWFCRSLHQFYYEYYQKTGFQDSKTLRI